VVRVERSIETQKAETHYHAITQRFVIDLYDRGIIEVPPAVAGLSDAEQFDSEVAASAQRLAAFHRLASARSILEIPLRSCVLSDVEAADLTSLAARLRYGLVLADGVAAHQVVMYRLLMERAKQLA
jgi:hypothetical protein